VGSRPSVVCSNSGRVRHRRPAIGVLGRKTSRMYVNANTNTRQTSRVTHMTFVSRRRIFFSSKRHEGSRVHFCMRWTPCLPFCRAAFSWNTVIEFQWLHNIFLLQNQLAVTAKEGGNPCCKPTISPKHMGGLAGFGIPQSTGGACSIWYDGKGLVRKRRKQERKKLRLNEKLALTSCTCCNLCLMGRVGDQ